MVGVHEQNRISLISTMVMFWPEWDTSGLVAWDQETAGLPGPRIRYYDRAASGTHRQPLRSCLILSPQSLKQSGFMGWRLEVRLEDQDAMV
jgi:hypothetical protein